MNDFSLNRLALRYVKTPSQEIEDQILRESGRFVKAIIRERFLAFKERHEEDLISEGLTGILKAIRRYDPDRSESFASFAYVWALGEMKHSLRKINTIYVPERIQEKLSKIHKVEQELANNLGRIPTDDEIADAVEISTETLKDLMNAVSVQSIHPIEEFALPVVVEDYDQFADKLWLKSLCKEYVNDVPRIKRTFACGYREATTIQKRMRDYLEEDEKEG
jgi:RNA polymerase sigma factor (sigma-70 family)